MPEITIKLTEEQLKFLTDYGQWSGLGSPEEVVIKTIFSNGARVFLPLASNL